MARGDDDLSLEFNVEGTGSRELDNIERKMRDLGNTAEYTSRKQVDGAKDAVGAYRQEADVLEALAASEAKLARARASVQTSANRITASNATTAATVATAGPKAQAGVDLVAQRALTEEVRGTNLEREQENRNLLTAGKLLTERERQQNLIQQRVAADAREADRVADRAASQQARAIKGEQDEQDAAERQGALYTKYLEEQEAGIQRKKAAEQKAADNELRDIQRNAIAAAAADAQAVRRLTDRTGRERSAAIAAERNARAIASPNAGSERRTAISTEKAVSSRDVEQTNALRYALYDTAQTATIVGTAIAGIGTAAIVAGAQGEQQFANLSATIGDTNYDLQALDASLLALTTENPTNLAETVGVAQLGAQMNIAEGDLDSFTKTITQFSATTNVTSEQAAESFGKISQLLNVPADEFQNLSSSIYQVGVDSVATESQILKTSEEIAGSAAAYGFTADQVVGLSGAFASLAIQPEQARGATTRIFNSIATAVAEGGPKLDNYARILNVTRDQAESLWKSDPSVFFTKLVKGLSTSEDRLADLRSIGAKGVYDTNVLQRLADNSDFLATSLETSKSAYDKGTAASDAYAKASDTLIARLKELGNSLVVLGINAGGPLLALLTPVVDIIKFIVNGFADLPPVILSGLAALTLLVGGFILFQGLTATAIAAVIGLRYVMTQLAATAGGTGLSIGTLQAQIALLAAEMGLGSAGAVRLTGTIAAAGIGARVSATGFSAMGLAMKAIPFVLFLSLAAAAVGALLKIGASGADAADGINIVSRAADASKVSSKDMVASFKEAYGEIQDFAKGSKVDQDIYNFASDAIGKVGLKSTLARSKDEIKAIDEQLASLSSSGNGEKASAIITELGLTTAQTASLLPAYTATLRDAGTASLKLGDDSLDAAGQLTAYEQAMDDAKDSVDQLFGSLNQASDFGNSIQQLFSGIYDAGNAFGYLSETGRTNLSNLQDSIAQTIAYGESLGLSSSNSVAMLFYQLQQSGVDTSDLLKLISSQPYIFSADLDISQVQKKLAMLQVNGGSAQGVAKNTGAFDALSGSMNKLAVSAPRAATGMSKTEKAAQKAAKEVHTLNDYASDLNTVLTDAGKYRFGVSDALDDISSQWKQITDDMAENKQELAQNKKDAIEAFSQYKDKIADARQELREYRADLLGLQSDLSQKQYFLKIAVQYGDTLRGNEISSEIADTQAQIAAKQKDVAQAQKDSRAPFENTTKAVDSQQKSLGELYDAYQDAIVEYARSGMSQEDLRAKVNDLRADFQRQAKQAGYSKTEIDKYSAAFDDMTVAINGVPRKITVAANVNPAVQALNDFLAKANSAKATPSVGDDRGVTRQNGIDAGNAWAAGVQERLNRSPVTVRGIVLDATKDYRINGVNVPHLARGGFVPGVNAFPVGGFVPGAAPADRRRDNTYGSTPNGVVSLQGGEPIMTNAARSKYGDAMFDQINALRFQPSVIRPQVTIQGGSDGGYTELSPYDRALLQEIARNAGLTISATAVQKANGAGNVASSRRRAG